MVLAPRVEGRRGPMRKLVESTFMSLDGVISAPQDWDTTMFGTGIVVLVYSP
jgi:hypothetical protein